MASSMAAMMSMGAGGTPDESRVRKEALSRPVPGDVIDLRKRDGGGGKYMRESDGCRVLRWLNIWEK